MAVIPQVVGPIWAEPVLPLIDTFPKGSIFEPKFNEKRISLVIARESFTNYFGRIHKKYKNMDTANIENLVNRLLKEQDQTFMNLVRDKTSRRDTLMDRFWDCLELE